MATGVRIYFEAFDETAAQEAEFSSSGQSWVDYGELTDGLYPDDPNEDPSNPTLRRYVTGEKDAVTLDGGFRLFPDSPGIHMGYWSAALSGADGAFTAPPVLLCDFGDTLHTGVGITLHFDVSTRLSDFTVQWFDADGAMLASKAVTVNTAETVFVEQHVENYAEVRILCEKTDAPYRYVKIQEIEFGQRLVYDDSNLVSASVTEEADLSGASVPAGSLRFEVVDPHGRLDPVNPEGIFAYLRRGMALHVDFLLNHAKYPGGLYYLDTWEGSDTGTAKMTAVDAVGRGDKSYESGFYSAVTPAGALDDIAQAIGVSSHAGTLPVKSLTGYIPKLSIQEAISHVCVASGGYARVTREGALRLCALEDDPESISESALLGDPVITRMQQPDSFRVEVNRYTISPSPEGVGTFIPIVYGIPYDTQLNETLKFRDLEGNDRILTDVTITVQEGTVLSYQVFSDRCDFVRLNGNVRVAYQGNVVTTEDAQTVVVQGQGAETLEAAGVPFITQDNYQTVLAALKAYCARNLKLKFRTPWRYGLDCGACVSVPTRFGNVAGNVTKLDIDLTGGLVATAEVLA